MSKALRSTVWAVTAATIAGGPAHGLGPPPGQVEQLGHWDGFAGNYGDVWGDGSFAYLGHFGHGAVNIVDISDPADPVAIEYALPPPNTASSAQDVKVADGLLFIGLENNANAGVHIVDVRDPMNPSAIVDVAITGFNSIHNVFYDNGFLYIADASTPRVGIIDLTTLDPDNPPVLPITTAKWILTNVGTSFVHDVTVLAGRLYASAWDSGLWIYDVTGVATQTPGFLGQTPDGGNNTHSCWPTANGDYVVTGEERPGGGIKVYRITDNGGSLTLQLTDSFALPQGEASSVHNQLMVGYRLYNSWYEAGLRVFDIDATTGLLTPYASFDTVGSVWGVYPYLGPGRVLLSDISEGLFVVSVSPGDLNGDGIANIVDLFALFAEWGPCPQPCPPTCPADLDGDCIVGITDLFILFANWS